MRLGNGIAALMAAFALVTAVAIGAPVTLAESPTDTRLPAVGPVRLADAAILGRDPVTERLSTDRIQRAERLVAERKPPAPVTLATPANLNRAEDWAARFRPVEPRCMENQARLGATTDEAARTCTCTIREIVSRSTDRQLELLLLISSVQVPGAKPATAEDAVRIRKYADQLTQPISQVCGARVDNPNPGLPSIADMAANSPS
jgi:hypothetical protein